MATNKSELNMNTFITSFKKANNLGVDKIDTTNNNIGLVDKLLAQFMNMDQYSQEIKDKTMAKTAVPPLPSYNVRTPHVEIWINGTRVIYPGKKDLIDVYVGITRNKGETDAEWRQRELENPYTGDVPDLDVFFKDLNLDMAFAGPIGTVHGTLTLFSRDPLDFLSFLYDFSSNLDEVSGLPTVSLKFGWDIAEFDQPILTPMLDFLVMNVGMADPSVDSQGSVFTLTLQDTGSAVYDNSSADFGLNEDYPQQQLRILVERVMGIRLFTLDDLLALEENGESVVSKIPTETQLDYTSLDVNNSSDLLVLNTLAGRLSIQEASATGNVTTGTIEAYGITLVGTDYKTATEARLTTACVPHLSNESLEEIFNYLIIAGAPYNTQIDLHNKDVLVNQYMYNLKSGTTYERYMNSTYTPGIGISPIINRDTFYWSNLEINPNKYLALKPQQYGPSIKNIALWYQSKESIEAESEVFQADVTLNQPLIDALYKQSAYMAINIFGGTSGLKLSTIGPNLRKDINRLFSPNPQTSSRTVKDVIDAFYAKDKQSVVDALRIIYSENPSLLTKTFFVNGRNPALRLNSGSFRDVITDLVMKTQCRWYPINNTQLEQSVKDAPLSNEEAYRKYREYKNAFALAPDDPVTKKLKDEYQKSKMKKSTSCRLVYVTNFPKKYKTTSGYTYIKAEKITDGAFILIPNINPLDTTDDEIPLTYGPGGSKYPYLYGGAQNIKQVLLANNNQLPKMFGEVIDAKVNYNNLTALIKGNFSEEVAIAEAGKRISRSTTIKQGPVTDKTEAQKKAERVADRTQRKKILEEQLKRLYPNKDSKWLEEQINLKLDKIASDLRAGGNLKDYATVYQGRRKLYKADSDPSVPPRNRTYSNPLPPEASAKDFIGQRLANMMYSSTSISMALMGDPFLIRQGIGAFELIHYFLDKKGTGLRYNYLLSGVFLVTSINHSISAGSFITNIKAYKIPPVNNTFTNTIDTWRRRSLMVKGKEGTMVANPNEKDDLTRAMNDLMTQSIILDEPFTTSADRITTATIQNTEVKRPVSDKDIANFYFNIK